MKINLKKKLSVVPIAVSEKDETGYPANERGYFRMYYKDAWEGTSFPIHPGIGGEELLDEFTDVINEFREEFKDLSALKTFCRANATDHLTDWCGYERWVLWLDLERGIYEFDVRTMPGDYNLYLRCYWKEEI